MSLHRLAPLAASATAVAMIAAAAAPAGAGDTVRITAKGAGGVKIGKRYAKLRHRRLIGKIRPGCELGGPNTRSARLKAPLKGGVNFTLDRPRRVTDILVRGGATARGVGIGATIPEIRDAFPKAKVDHSTESVFEITLVKIPKRGGGKLQFGVDTNTDRTTLIGIPYIAFCE